MEQITMDELEQMAQEIALDVFAKFGVITPLDGEGWLARFPAVRDEVKRKIAMLDLGQAELLVSDILSDEVCSSLEYLDHLAAQLGKPDPHPKRACRLP